MSGLDGAFLSLESSTTHLHILGALLFDPAGVPGGVDFWHIRDLVADRVSLVEPFRKRVVEVPFGLQHPAMVDDPEFDVDYHVRRASLPDPGGRTELAELVADLASRPLDRRRPLWEFHVVEGLEHGLLAVVPKIHHSIIDGVSAAEVMAAFFDLSPQPPPRSLFGASGRRRPARPPDREDEEGTAAPERGAAPRHLPWTPEPLPGEVERWRHVLGSLPGAAESVLRTVATTLRSARTSGGALIGPSAPVPPLPFEAPRTSINRAISPHRRVAFAELPLSEVRRIRDGLGGTANDVVLAVTSGAMRRFFAQRGEEPDSSLVAMVPVSVRAESERDSLGNRVSALLVSLASGVEDAPARLRQIRQGMQSAKEKSRSSESEVFTEWAEVVFPAVATRLSRLVTNLRVFDHLAPIFNLIVSNVPGPDFPLYLAGARMVAMYPVGPIVEGVGVNVTVFSYLDTLYVGVHGCWELAPDLEVIAGGMQDSLDELVAAANRRGRPVPWWHAELPA